MFNKVIVGIDGGSGGQDALALARSLAGPDSELLLVNAFLYERLPSRGSLDGYENLLREDSLSLLAKAAGDDTSLRTISVADTSPARALHEVAEAEHADLIVVGSCRHRGAVGRVLLGDVSRATLRGAHCAVAVAPRNYHDHATPITEIGVGFQKTPQAQAAFDLALGLARRSGASLRLHTAISVPAPLTAGFAYGYDWPDLEANQRTLAEQELHALAEDLDVPVVTETSVRSTGDGLQALSEKVDLLILGSRGWGTARKVLLGSTGDRLTHHAHCPLILVPSPATDSSAPPAPRAARRAPSTA